MNEILLGDIREIVKQLPAQSVNCIVTSPPYFGLRDYQTGKWEGGKAECDHVNRTAGSDKSTLKKDGRVNFGSNNYEENTPVPYRDTCPKCGAKRIDKQIGLEESPEAYVNTLVGIFRELKRVLRDDGSVWLNLGDSYAASGARSNNNGEGASTMGWPGQRQETLNKVAKMTLPTISHYLKPKNLIGIPWRVAFALQADGWILRSDIIWHKKNPMPESVTDRPTKAHEYIFLLSKKPRYYYDNEAVREASLQSSVKNNKYPANRTITPQDIRTNKFSGNMLPGKSIPSNPNGRNRRSVWSVSTFPFRAAHFAVFPPDLIRPCILAGCPQQVCGECGKPWVRVVEKTSVPRDLTLHRGKSEWAIGAKIRNDTDLTRSGQEAAKWKAKNPDRFLGFSPTCQCNADTRPGVVLDPFMGSGTVAQVAIETGRNWLGVELNPEYIELATKRIAQTQPPLPIEAVLR